MENTVDLIADCGSTKCDWLVVPSEGADNLVQTRGFSPFFHTSDDVYGILSQELVPQIASDVSNIWFYGTGVHDYRKAELIASALGRAFQGAHITVEHDLLAAARSTCGVMPGISCILGTGSNSCLFDGRQIIDNVPSLGWLLGDEGSGTHIGKHLLRAWYYRELPPDLHQSFEHQYREELDQIKDRVYMKGGNAYVAGFSRFVALHRKHSFMECLLVQSFDAFLNAHVEKYEGYRSLPVHFVGSIAHHYSDILEDCLKKKNLSMGRVIQKPIHSLKAFHKPQTNTNIA